MHGQLIVMVVFPHQCKQANITARPSGDRIAAQALSALPPLTSIS